jgi:hypothetical protein
MGQPCCTQSGVSWSMIDVPGEIAVVVHAEFDCVNCSHHHVGRSAVRFYSTRLSEGALTRGLTREPLERCLEQIAAARPPDLVLVLGTCPVEVIGDAFHEVVEEACARTGVRMVALRTSGLKLTSRREMLDWLYSTLAAACPPTGAPSGLALFGLPGPRRGRPEPVAVLARAGFSVQACLPRGADSSDWRGLRGAARTVLVDRSMFPRLVAGLEADGQVITEVPTLLELGLDVELLVQGAPDPDARAAF